MKKILVVLLIACFMLSGCGSSEPSHMTFDQFEEKYKRADWDKMLESPMEFIRDQGSIYSRAFSEAVPDPSSFTKTEESYGDVYKKDVVLFNRPFTATVTDYGNDFCMGSLKYKGDPDECYEIFTTLFEKIIAAEGDPSKISINNEEVDEAALRNAIKAGLTDESVSVQWGEKTTKTGIPILVSCWNYAGGELNIW